MSPVEYLAIAVCPVMAVMLARSGPQPPSKLLVLGEDCGILAMGSTGALGLHFLAAGSRAEVVLVVTVIALLLAGLAVAHIATLKRLEDLTALHGVYGLIVGGSFAVFGPLISLRAIEILGSMASWQIS